MDVSAEDGTGGLFVFAQKGRPGKADEDRVLHPLLHLFVHVAALGPVALIHKNVEAALHRRRITFEVELELVDQGAKQARCCRGQLLDEFRPRSDPW